MRSLLLCFLALAVLAPGAAVADVGPPAHMQISERQPGLYRVQWRVPKALPPRAVPTPTLPETCALVGDPEVSNQPAAWLVEADWRCEATLAGQEVGMRYPFPNLALTTVVRVDLLSGDRFAHVLTPDELSWRLPEGTAAPDLLLEGRRAVLAGAAHALRSWLHLAFLLAVGLLSVSAGNSVPRSAVRLVTAVSLGQVAGVLIGAVGRALASGPPMGIGVVLAEIGFAVGVVLLARQALEPEEERQRIEALAAAAGLMHGLGVGALLAVDLGEEASGVIAQLLAILGMDAVHLLGAVGAAYALTLLPALSSGPRVRGAVTYVAGATAMALALALSVQGEVSGADPISSSLQSPPGSATGSATGAASRRLAPAAVDAPIQSFISIEPFEVRHEVLFRLAETQLVIHSSGRGQTFRLDPAGTIEIEDQPMVLDLLERRVGADVLVDGQSTEGIVRRMDFMTVDATGALPRPNPVPEPVADAVVGVIVAYPAGGMPEEVTLRWDPLASGVEAIPATVIDPETVTSHTLTAEQPSLTWENALVEDPIPTVEAVEVEPTRAPVPLASLPLFLIAALLVVKGARDGRSPGAPTRSPDGSARSPYGPTRSPGGSTQASWTAASRVVLALAFVVGPVVQTSFALPGSAGRTPSERQARRILAGLLPNIYRALEFREEGMIYDRLAVSVAGETLTEVYLEQRQALEMEERGGAQARVETVEVLEAGDIESTEAGFSVRAVWTVGGMVTHFGHRHFRQNRYDARIGIVPDSGTWKIQSVEVLEQERVR
jgi:hypothetical protein